jgi:hypothetical protein
VDAGELRLARSAPQKTLSKMPFALCRDSIVVDWQAPLIGLYQIS